MICPNCNGSGKCPQCQGEGRTRCTTCNGIGTLAASCPNCRGSGRNDDGSICGVCAGTGQLANTCPICNGAGNFQCIQCSGGGLCKDCLGTGQVGRDLGELMRFLRIGETRLDHGHFELKPKVSLPAGIQYDEVNLPGEIVQRATSKTSFPLDLSQLSSTFENDTVFGPKEESDLPPESIWTAEETNQTSQVISQTFAVGEMVTTSDSVGITFSQGVTTANNMGMNIGIPPYFGQSFSRSDSFTFTTSTTQTRTITKERHWNYTTSVPVHPHTTVRVEVMYSKGVISCTFEGTVRVTGTVIGINQAKNIPIGVVIVPPPQDIVMPVGTLFRERPHSRVSVVSDNEITCRISGKITGIIGIKIGVSANERPPASSASASP